MRLGALRKEKGITQTFLASKLGVKQNTVAQWESGKRNPPAVKLPELARALGCTVDELFEEKGA